MWLSKYYITREFHNEASSGWRIDELLDLRFKVASDDLRDALSVIFGLSELKWTNAFIIDIRGPLIRFTYTSVHSEARSWSIPSKDPYEEAARQLLEQAPLPAEDEAPTPPLPPFFLSPRIRPPHTRVAMRQMRAAAPSTYHSLLPSGTPPLLPIPLPTPSTSRRVDIPEADTPPRKRLLLTTPRPSCEVGESSAAAAARQPGPTMAHRVDYSSVHTMETRIRDTKRRMMTALEMVNMRVSYQVDVRSRESSSFYHESRRPERSCSCEAEMRALEARVTVLETECVAKSGSVRLQDDLAVQHIMRTQALELDHALTH
ncbi:hypothetical protein Tco_0267995 [Tanacetum coccineum]